MSSAPQPSTPAKANGAPKANDDDHELQTITSAHRGTKMDTSESERPLLPIEEDIMQLARLGEIGAIQRLFDSGKFDAAYADEQGITPLHWAAINNHYALCHFLIQSGANVNAKGGDAVATPVLWAAKKCHYYVVNLLLDNGADPLLTDDQGFNLLHSATLDGNVFQIALLLQQDIPVDIQDAQGHTSLMWAAYKGYGAVMDLLLQWGASVDSRDDQGFTALHWALVKGAQHCIYKLVEYGSDRFAANNEGKSPAVVAKEMNSQRQWHLALWECGYNADGSVRVFPLKGLVEDKRAFYNRAYFLWPFFVGFWFLYILSHFVVYIGVPLAFLLVYGLQTAAAKALRWAPTDMKTMHRVPFLAGVFAGTLFWLGVRWVFVVLPWSFRQHPILNAFFGTYYALVTYFYTKAMIMDPGYVPKAGSRAAQRAIVDELVEKRQFDETHYCVICMTRRPLRSKHCKKCNRCVAKQDHHCPWVDNCIAVNNHRQFFYYVYFLALGILSWDWLAYSYMQVIPHPTDVTCNIISADLCSTINADSFTIVLTLWATVQLVWVSMLLIVQLVQITRGLTTYEAMTINKTGSSLQTFVATGSTSLEGASLTSAGRGPDPAAATANATTPGSGTQGKPPHAHGQSCTKQWMTMFGVDTFLATARSGSDTEQLRRQDRSNPFSRGWITNFRDFFCDAAGVFSGSRPNGQALLGGVTVDYTSLYEVPAKGRSSGSSSGSGRGLGRTRRTEQGMQYEAVPLAARAEEGEEDV